MIRKCLIKYIKANIAELNSVLEGSNDLILSKMMKPFATVSYVTASQSLWVLGDERRQNDIKLQLSLYSQTLDDQLNIRNKTIRILENIYTDGQPGIPLMGLFDKLTTTDYLTYSSFQSDFYTTMPPADLPVVYRNGVIESPLNYTVDYVNGAITFLSACSPTDDIRADYYIGYQKTLGGVGKAFIDFSIASIVDTPITYVANLTHKFNTFITLDTFLYERRKGMKLW